MRGGDRRHDNRHFTESECIIEKQWCVVWQKDASGTEGESLQNYGQTSYAVWCRDLGNNEGTISTTIIN